MAPEMESPAQFTPLRRASLLGRVLAAIAGAVLWPVAVIVAALVVYGRDAVEVGVIVTFVAFLASLIVCWARRRSRLREEQAAETS